MNTLVIIQARMTSSRLPGKILLKVAGQPLLGWEIDRLKKCKETGSIVVATTKNKDDNAVVELCKKKSVSFFRGPEDDVLARYTGAAREFSADIVVRITADCPLIDPGIVDTVAREMKARIEEFDYCSNVIKRTYPAGLDAEALPMSVLEKIDKLATSRQAREHVTYLINYERPETFRRYSSDDSEE